MGALKGAIAPSGSTCGTSSRRIHKIGISKFLTRCFAITQPYHLVYGNPVAILTSLTNEPEPQFNYNDYQYEIKRQMQESQALARNHLLKAKEKSKEYYDRNSKRQDFNVGDKVLLQDKTSKNKLTPRWLF